MKIVEERKVPPSVKEWTIEEEASLTMLEVEPISIKETALKSLNEQHKRELLATFKVLSKQEKAAMLTEMTVFGVEDGKKTEEQGKAEEEDSEEEKI